MPIEHENDKELHALMCETQIELRNEKATLTNKFERCFKAMIKYEERLRIATVALKQVRIYSECYDELIMTVDDALSAIGEISSMPERHELKPREQSLNPNPAYPERSRWKRSKKKY